jgi:phage terminase Nu1 subunit (DNA packaging protein)
MRDCALPMLTRDQFARLVGRSTSQIDRLVKKGIVPKAARGSFDPEQAIPAVVEYYASGRAESADAAQAQLRLTQARTREVEQRIAERDRVLVPLADVQLLFDLAMADVAAALDGLPGRCAGELAALTDPAHIRQRLFDECRSIRAATAHQLEALAAPAPRSVDPEAAGGPNRG